MAVEMSGNNLHAARAQLLLDQGRYDQALTEWTEALRFNPDSDLIHFNMAVCLINMGRAKGAESILKERTWTQLADDSVLPHLQSYVHWQNGKFKKAEQAIRLAITLAHGQKAEHFATLSSVLVEQEKYSKSWQAALQGLAIDPENKACLRQQLRLMARVKPKSDGWEKVIRQTLAVDPTDPVFHTATGWLYWSNAKYNMAQEHFRTALQNDPNDNWAEKGMRETFKAESRIYRMMLPVFEILSKSFMALVPISGLLATNLLKLTHEVPAARSSLIIGIGSLTILGVLPLLFDVLLLKHPIGRYTITPEHRKNQLHIFLMLVGVCLFLMALIQFDIYGLF